MSVPTFHPGERTVQLRAGEAAIADRNATMVASTILSGARPFIQKQFMVVLASCDADGRPWSSVVYGQPGFVRPEGNATILLDMPFQKRDDTDLFWRNIEADPAIGMLFIELGTRRRYRVNGSVTRNDEAGIEIAVREAYPNCPRYIQRRHLRDLGAEFRPDGVATGSSIAGGIETLVRTADTIFLASAHPDSGADASHRGGPRGFVELRGPRTLRIPDYNGNSMFNTFGNLELDPHIGLCIPDFEGGRLLHVSGRARLLWDQMDAAEISGGTGRFLEIEVDRWVLRQVPQRLEWEFLDASPFNPPAAEV